MTMQNGLQGMMRGLMGGGRKGMWQVNQMPKVGGFSGGGGGMRGGGSTPSVSAPGASDPLRDQRSALSHGDDLINGYLDKWFPTPQEQQKKKNADLFAQALLGGEGQQGLVGQNITPELLATAAGTMRQGGADANGLLGLAEWAVPAMQQQQELEWKKARADLEEQRLAALIRNMDARTANTQAAGARAAAKAAGGGGASAGDYF